MENGKKQLDNSSEVKKNVLKNTINPIVLELVNQVTDIPYNGDNINSRD